MRKQVIDRKSNEQRRDQMKPPQMEIDLNEMETEPQSKQPQRLINERASSSYFTLASSV